MLPGQMSPWQLESVLDVPRSLPLKFTQNQVNSKWDTANVEFVWGLCRFIFKSNPKDVLRLRWGFEKSENAPKNVDNLVWSHRDSYAKLVNINIISYCEHYLYSSYHCSPGYNTQWTLRNNQDRANHTQLYCVTLYYMCETTDMEKVLILPRTDFVCNGNFR